MYNKTKHRHRLPTKDWLVSRLMMDHALRSIVKRAKINRTFDIPYLAGYSQDGKTFYIDRHLPEYFVTKKHRIHVDRFLILHESIEKALIDQLGLHYQHAHQIALRTEQAAIRAEGVSWTEYDRFMQNYIKEVDDEKLERVPANFDTKPYRDEHDQALLKQMKLAMKKEVEQGKQ